MGSGEGLGLSVLQGRGLCAGAYERGWLEPSHTGFGEGGQAGGASWGAWKEQEPKLQGREQSCRESP